MSFYTIMEWTSKWLDCKIPDFNISI